MRDTDLTLGQKELIPKIDWLRLDRVSALRVEFPENGIGVRLVIWSCYSGMDGDAPVILQFDEVRDLKMPVLTGAGFSFGEFVVDDVSDHQLEGIRFRARDFLAGISFYCARISILSSSKEEPGSI